MKVYKVYLVTQGAFDDYQVLYVFRDEDAAERHVESWNAYWNARYPGQGSMTRRVEAHKIVGGARAEALTNRTPVG